jgi:hypothetical protein
VVLKTRPSAELLVPEPLLTVNSCIKVRL